MTISITIKQKSQQNFRVSFGRKLYSLEALIEVRLEIMAVCCLTLDTNLFPLWRPSLVKLVGRSTLLSSRSFYSSYINSAHSGCWISECSTIVVVSLVLRSFVVFAMYFSLLPLILASRALLAEAAALPYVFERAVNDTTALAPSQSDVHSQLGPQLSPGASIYFPNSAQFANATSRWSSYAEPQIAVVVEPATAKDVATTVCQLA